MDNLKIAALIPARYDSSRFPGKALAEINSKPMIVRVLEAAAESELISEVYAATDDKRIKKAVEKAGAQALMTSSKHQCGTDRIAEAAENLAADLIVNIQGDEPLVTAEVIEKAVEPFFKEKELKMSTLKKKIKPKKALDPDLVKVITDKNDYALYFSRSPIPYYREQKQSQAEYFQHIGLYVYRRDFLLKYAALAASPLEKAESLEQLRALENGFKIKVVETEAELIGVDRKEDIALVEQEIAARENNS